MKLFELVSQRDPKLVASIEGALKIFQSKKGSELSTEEFVRFLNAQTNKGFTPSNFASYAKDFQEIDRIDPNGNITLKSLNPGLTKYSKDATIKNMKKVNTLAKKANTKMKKDTPGVDVVDAMRKGVKDIQDKGKDYMTDFGTKNLSS